jgi:hypothetical protein
MKAFVLFLFLTLLLRFVDAAEPSVVHYQTIKEDIEKGVLSGELILKVNNPTDRTFYVLGFSITDIPYRVEVLKDGKWSVVPSRVCGTGMNVRPFLPNSYIVFTAHEAPVTDPDITFRLRVYLYTEPDIFSLYTEPNRKPWVDFVSPAFNSNDFREKREGDIQLPRLPGIEPLKVPEIKSGTAPKIPGLEPLSK